MYPPSDYITYALYSLPSSALGFISVFSLSFHFVFALSSLPFHSTFHPFFLLLPSLSPFSCLIYLAPLMPELLQGTLTLTLPSCFHCVSVQARETVPDFHYNSRRTCAPLYLSSCALESECKRDLLRGHYLLYAPSVLTCTISGFGCIRNIKFCPMYVNTEQIE